LSTGKEGSGESSFTDVYLYLEREMEGEAEREPGWSEEDAPAFGRERACIRHY
jgi:hypothetical protein